MNKNTFLQRLNSASTRADVLQIAAAGSIEMIFRPLMDLGLRASKQPIIRAMVYSTPCGAPSQWLASYDSHWPVTADLMRFIFECEGKLSESEELPPMKFEITSLVDDEGWLADRCSSASAMTGEPDLQKVAARIRSLKGLMQRKPHLFSSAKEWRA